MSRTAPRRSAPAAGSPISTAAALFSVLLTALAPFAAPAPPAHAQAAAAVQPAGTRAAAGAAAPAGEKRVLTIDEYALWRSIRSAGLSEDGKWLVFGYAQREVDDTLVVRRLADGKEYRIGRASSPQLSDDGRWVAYQLAPSVAEIERLEKARQPVLRQAELMSLETGEKRAWDDIASFAFAKRSKTFVAKKRKADREAKHNGTDLIVRHLERGYEELLGSVEDFAFNKTGTHLAYTVDARDKDGNGVYLLDLASNARRALENGDAVFARLTWDEHGRALAALKSTEKKGYMQKENVLLAFPDAAAASAAGKAATRVAFDAAKTDAFPKDFVISEKATLEWSPDLSRVFVGIKEQTPDPTKRWEACSAAAKPVVADASSAQTGPTGGDADGTDDPPAQAAVADSVIATTQGGAAGQTGGGAASGAQTGGAAGAQTGGAASGAQTGGAAGAQAGGAAAGAQSGGAAARPRPRNPADSGPRTLTGANGISIVQVQPAEDRDCTADEPADVDIWHVADERLQSVQMVRASRDRDRTYRSVVHLDGTFVRLADERIENVDLTRDGRWAIGGDDKPYVSDWQPSYNDYFRIDVRTGERTTVLTQQLRTLGFSPDSKLWLYWKDGHIWTYRLDDDAHVNLTANAPISFVDDEFDRYGEKPPYGVAGWTADRKAVILEAKYDLWLQPLDGGKPTNLTQGAGAKDEIRFQYVRLDSEERFIDLKKPVLLTAYGQWTKKAGFYRLDNGKLTPLVYDDAQFGRPTRAKNADVYLFTRERFESFPDYYVVGGDAVVAELAESAPDARAARADQNGAKAAAGGSAGATAANDDTASGNAGAADATTAAGDGAGASGSAAAHDSGAPPESDSATAAAATFVIATNGTVHRRIAFDAPVRVTDANPHQADFDWGKRILFDFTNDDGVRLQGTLIVPDGYQPGQRLPMLVNFYEKNSQNLHSYEAPGYRSSPNFSGYVSNGYLVMQPDVHFRTGRSHSDMLECVEAAVRKVIEMGYADPARVALHGHSYSGQGSAFISTRSKMFAAVVAGAAATDLVSDFNQLWKSNGTNQHGYDTYGQGRFATNPFDDLELYMDQSAVFNARTMDTPLLLLHGTDDGSVEWLQAVEFYNALRFNDKPVILLSYPGEAHGLRKYENQKDFQIRTRQFLDHHLKGAPAPEWMSEGRPFLEKQRMLDSRKTGGGSGSGGASGSGGGGGGGGGSGG